MVRRIIFYISILLLCIFTASCSKPAAGAATGEEEQTIINSDSNDNKDDNRATVSKADTQEEEESNLKVNDTLSDNSLTGQSVQLSQLLQDVTGNQKIQETLDQYPAETILNTDEVKEEDLDFLFYSEELNQEIKTRITGKSYGENCDIPYSELCYIRVLHRGFDGLTHIGELIVDQFIAEDMIDIFKELYGIDYPIERMELVDDYNADDNASMEADNTSAFNYRVIDGKTRLSEHSYGTAIDINPLYNPYIREMNGKTEVLPEASAEYADRSKDNPYYIKEGDPCWTAFTKRGFSWGGTWKNSKDYQHFQTNPDE
jgi:hypothetical protein